MSCMVDHGGSPQSLEEEIPCTLLAKVSTNGDLLEVAKARVLTRNVMHNKKLDENMRKGSPRRVFPEYHNLILPHNII